MIQKVKDFTALMGFGVYIALGALGCASYGLVLGAYGFVFHVKISLADILAGFLFILVSYALYVGHAEHIRRLIQNLSGLVSKSVMSLIAISAVLAGLFVLVDNHFRLDRLEKWQLASVGPQIPASKIETTPTTTKEPMRLRSTFDQRFVVLEPMPPAPNHAEKTKSSKIMESIVGDVCQLDGAFSPEILEACHNRIRATPPLKGVGGPAYEINKKGEYQQIQRQQRKNIQPRGGLRLPLNLKPPLQ